MSSYKLYDLNDWWSLITTGYLQLQSSFIEIALQHGCSPVNLLHSFRTPFPTKTSGWLLLRVLFWLIVINFFYNLFHFEFSNWLFCKSYFGQNTFLKSFLRCLSSRDPLNPNLGGGNFTPPHWLSINNSKTGKAVTLAFCSTQ